MEQKNILLSALGIGVGVGLGLVSGQTVSNWANGNAVPAEIAAQQIQQELMRQLVDGRNSGVTFDQFPYYLCETTRVLLTSAASVHLKHYDYPKHIRNLSPASKAILLSGPTELYQQTLAKALAHHFESKLLLLDAADFSLKMQNKYRYERKKQRSISEMTLEGMSNLFGSLSAFSLANDERAGSLNRQNSSAELKLKNASTSSGLSSMSSQFGSSAGRLTRTGSWCFDDELFLQSLYKVLVSVSKQSSTILYLRDVDKLFLQSQKLYKWFQKFLTKLPSPVLVLGSRLLDAGGDSQKADERLSVLFPYNIEIQPPEDQSLLDSWRARLQADMKIAEVRHIANVLAANDVECYDLHSISDADTKFLSNNVEEIVLSAISYHLMNNKEPVYSFGKLVISAESLSRVLSIFQEGKSSGKNTQKPEANADSSKEARADEAKKSIPVVKGSEIPPPAKKQEVPPDNEFEKRMRSLVIPANEIGVTFADIGALDEIKESLQELVMLPLRRPDLFNGGLLKPCRGVLLFGPPGTGKTMLAKAIANEAAASFINVSMSTITSKYFGEYEKNVRALFTLAAKVSPAIIFVDEVDSLLGQRTRDGEHEAMRTIKNEFMTHWDGLMTKPNERILVLAATNRPFDLDEAIIRRFQRRIMVGLPTVESREKILRTLLSKETTEDLDFKELATMTEGYSGSDLKNLCITAAYRPVRELLQQERLKDEERKRLAEEAKDSEDASASKEEAKEERAINLRPLNMQDLRQAKSQLSPSFAAEGQVMNELKQWNDLYGEGGSRKKGQLSYFF